MIADVDQLEAEVGFLFELLVVQHVLEINDERHRWTTLLAKAAIGTAPARATVTARTSTLAAWKVPALDARAVATLTTRKTTTWKTAATLRFRERTGEWVRWDTGGLTWLFGILQLNRLLQVHIQIEISRPDACIASKACRPIVCHGVAIVVETGRDVIRTARAPVQLRIHINIPG